MKTRLLYFASVFILMMSCSKESEEETPPVPTTNVTCKQIELKDLNDGFTSTYHYNAQGVLIKRETGFPNSTGGTSLYEMEYDTSGKLIKMVWSNTVPNLYYLLLYNYNSEGQMVRLDFHYRNPDGSFVPVTYFLYEYNSPDELKSRQQYKHDFDGEVLQQTEEFSYRNGLMVRVDVTNQQKQNNKTYLLEYDDKKNPAHEHHLIHYQSHGYPFKHNITKITALDYQGQVIAEESSAVTYTYNQQGYPLTMKGSLKGNRKANLVYTYKCK